MLLHALRPEASADYFDIVTQSGPARGSQLETLPQPFPTRVAILAQDTSWRL